MNELCNVAATATAHRLVEHFTKVLKMVHEVLGHTVLYTVDSKCVTSFGAVFEHLCEQERRGCFKSRQKFTSGTHILNGDAPTPSLGEPLFRFRRCIWPNI